MKHILLSIALLFPTFAVTQQTEEVSECPNHITKVLDLQDVDVAGIRPHYTSGSKDLTAVTSGMTLC